MSGPTELARQIARVAALLGDELRAADPEPGSPGPHSDVTHALSTARSLQSLADQAMAALVTDARARGVTWQAIGDALGISRQAAFQRFGSPIDPRTGTPLTRPSADARAEAIARADLFLDHLTAHDWEAAAGLLGPTIGAQLDAEGLAAAWAQVLALGGDLERRHPAATTALADEVTVVEEHLSFEAADLVARLSYDAEQTMVGLWFLPAEQALTEKPAS